MEKRFVTETVIIGLTGYQYDISDKCIIRYGMKTEEKSLGYLVKKHFDEVCNVLYLIHLLKDTLVKEAMEQFWIEDQEKYEKAPLLAKCLDALEQQLSLMSEAEYDEYFKYCKTRYAGEDPDGDYNRLPFWSEMQDLFWHILDLRNGKWHGSKNPRYEGRRGIPRIETIGKRMYSEALDLIWKMDNEKID